MKNMAMYEPELKTAFPDFDVKFFQAGSEVVATKIQTELAAGKTKADLLMTSDVFFFQDLGAKGHLATLEQSMLKKTAPSLYHKDKRYIVSRFPVMVLAYHSSTTRKRSSQKFCGFGGSKI